MLVISPAEHYQTGLIANVTLINDTEVISLAKWLMSRNKCITKKNYFTFLGL